jgi:probable phosphoglycerate mutase
VTEFLLVRHGETVWNSQARLQGQQDSLLTDLGLAQAQAIANRLRSEAFTALYASDLIRAYRTAEHIAQLTGQAVTVDPRLREQAYGIFEGLTEAECAAQHPEAYQTSRTSADFVIPGGESRALLRQRAIAVFADLANRHPHERVVVVSHGGLLSAFLRYLLDLAPLEPTPYRLHNASLSQVCFDRATQRWHALHIGDTAHLELSSHIY